MKELIGTGVALVTPFTKDKEIDLHALERLVEYQIDNGVNYLVVLGTTGESTTLSKEEKEVVRNKVVEINNGRLPLVVGVGGNDTKAVVNELTSADYSNFNAILSVTPYYNKPTQNGIYEHFKAVALASPLPVILYNVLPRTGSNIEPSTVLRLASEFENIVAIKEASGNFEQALEILRSKPKEFMVVSGEDMTALSLTLAGGSGVISVMGQGMPREFSSCIQYGLHGKSKEAFDIFYKLMPCIDLIFEEGNPSGIKALLTKLGICGLDVRLPLVNASAGLQEKIGNFINN